MTSSYTEIRGAAMGIDVQTSAPTSATEKGGSLDAGRIYQDSSTGKLYVYDGTTWEWAVGGTTTSTSTTSTSSSSTSSTSSSTSTTSSSTSTTSTSTTSTSTSTTLY